jgi:thiol-disulfide isomerase/thioredoxin
MESTPALGGKNWKTKLMALGLGVVAAAAVFGTALTVSEDLRLSYLDGAVFLFLGAAWLGSKRRCDWLDAALLYPPASALFGFFVLQQLPFLWPHLVLWAIAVVVGLLLARSRREGHVTRISAVILLLAVSVWYCAAYIPDQLKRAMNHVGAATAPGFAFQPVSDGAVPTEPVSGKILVIDFFGTWCPPCVAELPELERVRSDLQDRDDIAFVIVGTNAGGDTPEKLRAFGRSRHVGLPLAFDPGGKAHATFGLTGFPGMVVIDRTGRVRLTRQGYNSSETTFRRDLVELLRSL